MDKQIFSLNRTILHVDFDSFFASCEQHFNPNLRNKPIGITAENGRTCIIAASKEAKKLGIKTGSRTWEADQLCPSITYVKGDFDRYLDITKKFIEICSFYSPFVEVFSLDEVFIDMTATLHLFSDNVIPNSFRNPNPKTLKQVQGDKEKAIISLVQRFKKQIADEISPVTTVSVGVSYNKLLAKLASGLNKPDGFMMITRKNLDQIYKNTKLTDICGIGERLRCRLNKLGIYNLMQLRDYPLRLLKKEFGNVCSQNLLSYAWANDNSPVISYLEESEPKSVGRAYCLPRNEYDQNKILLTLSELSEEVARRLRSINKKGRTISLYLCGERNSHENKTIHSYTNSGKEIYSVIKLFMKKWEWKEMVRQIHISVSNLIDDKYSNLGLFEDSRESIIQKTVDKLNQKFGTHTIRRGYTLNSPKLRTKPNGYFGDKNFYTRQFKQA